MCFGAWNKMEAHLIGTMFLPFLTYPLPPKGGLDPHSHAGTVEEERKGDTQW